MNFRECKKNYPVGMIMGNFILNYDFPIYKEELQRRIGQRFYAEFFYYYNKETKKFHRADFLYKNIQGYITVDGVNFHPFASDEMGIYYLDNSKYDDDIRFESDADEDNEKFATKIDEAWLKLHPDWKPIRTLKDLEKMDKYDF